MANLNVDYPNILQLFERFLVGRTESRAFLHWFLENYYRLDEFIAHDCICDGPDDKGVDGIYVDENLGNIDILQCKIVKNKSKTLGDSRLKEFFGTINQFSTAKKMNDVINTTNNIELKKVIIENDIINKIDQGYNTNGVFITNVNKDNNANTFLSHHDNIIVYDKDKLESSYISTERSGTINKSITFDVHGYDLSEYSIGPDIKVLIAPLSATDIIRMEGIKNQRLFTWDVRQSLGRTKVNKDIEKSINNVNEHKHFLLYHNGITVLCKKMTVSKDGKIKINGYSVVNGCQSINSMYENKPSLSDELRIFTRLIQISPDDELALQITQYSNNQNGIKPRDLQSNNPLQVRLQNEFKNKLGKKIFYQLSRGEKTKCPEVIDNELTARILLAFDLKEPWTCHQTYKLFDELHSRIFSRPEVKMERIIIVNDIYNVINDTLGKLENKSFANYTLTKYFMLYLLREVLEKDERGKNFYNNPEKFIGDFEKRELVKTCIRIMLEDLIIDINYEIRLKEEEGEYFDYKRELKSPSKVRLLKRQIIPNYLRQVERGRISSFGEEWDRMNK